MLVIKSSSLIGCFCDAENFCVSEQATIRSNCFICFCYSLSLAHWTHFNLCGREWLILRRRMRRYNIVWYRGFSKTPLCFSAKLYAKPHLEPPERQAPDHHFKLGWTTGCRSFHILILSLSTSTFCVVFSQKLISLTKWFTNSF